MLLNCFFNSLLDAAEHNSSDEDSGSDEEEDKKDNEEDEEDRRSRQGSPQLTFFTKTQTCFTLWKNVLIVPENHNPQQEIENYTKSLKKYSDSTMWTFLFLCGGYFAGAVFSGNKLMKHKTFRRYTTRKKQGGSQSSKDSKGSAAQSSNSPTNC